MHEARQSGKYSLSALVSNHADALRHQYICLDVNLEKQTPRYAHVLAAPLIARVNFEPDLAKSTQGTTVLTFNSRGDETHIGINADKSQLNIDSVWVNGHPAEFEHDQCVGFGTQSSVANEQQRHYQLSSPPFDLRDARTRELERARLADRGELLVKLPLALRGIEKGELRVEIQYRLKPSRPGVARTGIHFVSGGGGASASASVYAERPRSAYTVAGRYGRTSSWLPCVEGSFSTFEIAILCDERYGACGAVAVGRRMDNTTEGEGLLRRIARVSDDTGSSLKK